MPSWGELEGGTPSMPELFFEFGVIFLQKTFANTHPEGGRELSCVDTCAPKVPKKPSYI